MSVCILTAGGSAYVDLPSCDIVGGIKKCKSLEFWCAEKTGLYVYEVCWSFVSAFVFTVSLHVCAAPFNP